MNTTLAIDNELYEECKGRIISKAVSFSKSYNTLCISEMIGVGNESFCKAVATFDETSGVPFTAYLSLLLDRDMTTFARKETTRIMVCDFFNEGHAISTNENTWLKWQRANIDKHPYNLVRNHPSTINTKRRVEFKLALEKLSREAQLVVRIFLVAPCEVLGLTGDEGPKKIKGILRDYLREELQWPWKTIWSVSKEIRMTLRQF